MSEHQLWNELGNIHINVGEYEQALGAYKKAIDLAPKSGRAQSNLATAYVRLSEPGKAIPHYQRSIELFEDFNEKAVSWHQLGIAYQMLEDDKNTLLAFERAAALDPENPLYQDDLAVILSEIPDDMLDVTEAEEEVLAETTQEEEVTLEAEATLSAEEEGLEEPIEKKAKGAFASWIENTMSALDKDVRNSAQAEAAIDTAVAEDVGGAEEVEEVNEAPPVPAAIAKDLIPMLGEDDPELEASVDELISEISQEIALDADATTDTAKEYIEDETLSLEDLEEEVDDLSEAQEADEIIKHKWLALSEQDDDDDEQEGETAEDLVMSQTEIVAEEPVAEVEEEPLSTETEAVIAEIEEEAAEEFAVNEDETIAEELVAEIEEEPVMSEAEAITEEPVIEAGEKLLSTEVEAATEEPVMSEAEVVAEEPIAEESVEEVEEELLSIEAEAVAEEPVAEIEEDAKEELAVDEDETKAIVEELAAEIEEEVLAEIDKEEEIIPEVIAEESIEEIEEKAEEEFAVSETEVIAEEPVVETEEELTVSEAEDVDEVEALAELEEEITEEPAAATTPANGNGNGNGNGHADALANASVWGEMGNIFFTEDILDGALIAYKKALELDSDYGAVMHNLALLHMQKGNFAEAVKLYEQSISYLDDNATRIKTWNNIGNAYRAMKDYDQAKEAYRKADELDTENITLENWTRQGLLSTEKS